MSALPLRWAEPLSGQYVLESDPDHPGFYMVRSVPIFSCNQRTGPGGSQIEFGADDLRAIEAHHRDLERTKHYPPVFEGHHQNSECRPKIGNFRDVKLGELEFVDPETHKPRRIPTLFATINRIKPQFAKRMLEGDLEYRSIEIKPGTPRISGLSMSSTVPPFFKFPNTVVTLAKGTNAPAVSAMAASEFVDGSETITFCYAESMRFAEAGAAVRYDERGAIDHMLEMAQRGIKARLAGDIPEALTMERHVDLALEGIGLQWGREARLRAEDELADLTFTERQNNMQRRQRRREPGRAQHYASDRREQRIPIRRYDDDGAEEALEEVEETVDKAKSLIVKQIEALEMQLQALKAQMGAEEEPEDEEPEEPEEDEPEEPAKPDGEDKNLVQASEDPSTTRKFADQAIEIAHLRQRLEAKDREDKTQAILRELKDGGYSYAEDDVRTIFAGALDDDAELARRKKAYFAGLTRPPTMQMVERETENEHGLLAAYRHDPAAKQKAAEWLTAYYNDPVTQRIQPDPMKLLQHAVPGGRWAKNGARI